MAKLESNYKKSTVLNTEKLVGGLEHFFPYMGVSIVMGDPLGYGWFL